MYIYIYIYIIGLVEVLGLAERAVLVVLGGVVQRVL